MMDETGTTVRFTVYGSPGFEAGLAAELEKIGDSVSGVFAPGDLAALVLGGGYGRGEGGVLGPDGAESPYNDLDFFVIVQDIPKAKRSHYHRELERISAAFSASLGIDVDFAYPKTVSEVARLPYTQMWVELKQAHRVVRGDGNVMRLYQYDDLNDIPLDEARKLLLNRGVGLFLARERLRKATPDAEDIDFIARNVHKAALASGDALLISLKRYHRLARERLELLTGCDLPAAVDKREVCRNYGLAVSFKLRPSLKFTRDSLAELHGRILASFMTVYFHIFGLYYGVAVTDGTHYRRLVLAERDWPGLLKNVALNVRDFKLKNINRRWYGKYPRCRLYYGFPSLLFSEDETDRVHLAQALELDGGSPRERLEREFVRIWEKYN